MLPRFRDQRRITSMTDHYAGVGAAGCPSRGHDVLGVEDLDLSAEPPGIISAERAEPGLRRT